MPNTFMRKRRPCRYPFGAGKNRQNCFAKCNAFGTDSVFGDYVTEATAQLRIWFWDD